MDVCDKCNVPLNPQGQCPHCDEGQMVSPTEELSEKPSREAENASGQRALVIKEEQSVSDSDTVSVLKGFFSSTPTKALETAVHSQEKLFLPLGIAHILLSGLALLLVPGNLIVKFFGPVGLIAYLIPRGALVLLGVLSGILSLLLWAGLFKLICLIHKKTDSFSSVLNVVTVAFLPATVGLALAALFSFFAPLVSVVVILLANFVSMFMLYSGLQKQLGAQSGPIWPFVVSCLVFIVFVLLFLTQIVLPFIITSIFNNIEFLLENLMTGMDTALENLGADAVEEIMKLEIFGYKLQEIIQLLETITATSIVK